MDGTGGEDSDASSSIVLVEHEVTSENVGEGALPSGSISTAGCDATAQTRVSSDETIESSQA